MTKRFRVILLIVFCVLSFSSASSAEGKRPIRIGFGFGTGKQPFFPFSSPDYSYKVQGYKILLNYRIKESGTFCYELQAEPGIYFADHRLLNEFFIQPKAGTDYLELRKRFMAEKRITEYVLNIGFQVRMCLNQKWSLFVLGSIGPMISDTQTERLAKGFAFSDIIAAGVAFKTRRVLFELRPGLRHVSNANLQKPNGGHNSSNIDFGISISLW